MTVMLKVLRAPFSKSAPRVEDGSFLQGYAWWNGLAFVLLVAALLKASRFAPEVLLDGSRPHDRLIQFSIIFVEAALAGWMLSGLHRQATRWIVISCFVVFAVAALTLALGGEKSCGCFGWVHVNPWWTFAFDVAVVLSVWRFPGSQSPSPAIFTHPARLWRGSLVLLAFAAAFTGVMGGVRVLAPSDELTTSGGSRIIILKPDQWVGKKFPLFPYLISNSSMEALKRDEWLVVLYQHDCSHCQEMVPKIWRWSSTHPEFRVAFVEIPPYGSQGDSLVPQGEGGDHLLVGQLSESHGWFAKTPLLIELQEGMVSRAYQDQELHTAVEMN